MEDLSVDKMGVNDKYNWTADNLDMIIAIAFDPEGTKHLWYDGFDNPWVSLQCCYEIVSLLSSMQLGVDHYSKMIVSIDGANNGLQHLSAMTLDEEAGELVGLVPVDYPKDFYVLVMQGIIAKQKGTDLGDKLSTYKMKYMRKGISKRGVMTRHYDAGRGCIADTIESDSYDVGLDINGNESFALAGDLIESYNDLCSKPMESKKFLQDLIALRLGLDEYNTVDWTTPSGFPVKVAKFVEIDKQIKGKIAGNSRKPYLQGYT